MGRSEARLGRRRWLLLGRRLRGRPAQGILGRHGRREGAQRVHEIVASYRRRQTGDLLLVALLLLLELLLELLERLEVGRKWARLERLQLLQLLQLGQAGRGRGSCSGCRRMVGQLTVNRWHLEMLLLV